MSRKKGGWYGESARHSLAAKGVKTGRNRKHSMRDIDKAHGYVRRIRNKQKKQYAAEYLSFLRGYGPEPELPKDLSYMGAQAARMNLEDILGPRDNIRTGKRTDAFRDLPKDPTKMTPRQREEVISFLAAKPLKELRKRQDIVDSQIALAHRQRNTAALNNLREMYQHLVEAIDRKVFGGGN